MRDSKPASVYFNFNESFVWGFTTFPNVEFTTLGHGGYCKHQEDCLQPLMEDTMDNAVSRPASTGQPAPIARPDYHAKTDAVATELPSSKSVQSAWPSEPVENRISPQAATISHMVQIIKTTEQRYERDRETSTLVFKQIDPNSGEVIMQLPNQSLLNLRAYLKQQASSSNAGLQRSA